MIAIFNDQQAAVDYADEVHRYLQANRPGYSAEVWEIPVKHPMLYRWAVACPPENVACSGAKVETLPDDWTPAP